MKNNNFWFFSLVALLVLGVALQWPTILRIAIIANSGVVLFHVVSRVWEAYHG
ncbi:MAG: hypothetical protein LUD84_10980 [Clostridiales bacterium]|nr:hypothetical protein [Clostridiales bacterium]